MIVLQKKKIISDFYEKIKQKQYIIIFKPITIHKYGYLARKRLKCVSVSEQICINYIFYGLLTRLGSRWLPVDSFCLSDPYRLSAACLLLIWSFVPPESGQGRKWQGLKLVKRKTMSEL